MSLSAALLHVLLGYEKARGEPVAEHPMGRFIRRDLVDAITETLPAKDLYRVKGSVGQSDKWAQTPWAAILDPLVTESPTRGFYLVFLFRSDSAAVYLSLNQGVTEVKNVYGRR